MICCESKHFKIIDQLKKHNYSLSKPPNRTLNLAKNLYFSLKNALFTVCVGDWKNEIDKISIYSLKNIGNFLVHMQK